MIPTVQNLTAATPVPSVATLGFESAEKVLGPDLHARWIDIDELETKISAWNHLAQNALWCTPALESNYLLPALKYLDSQTVRMLVVEDQNAPEARELVAVVPIETKRIYRLPFKAAEVWRHDQCFNATPLLDRRCATGAWERICELLVSEDYSLLSLDTVSADPDVDAVFKNLERRPGVTRFQRDRFERAGFAPHESGDDYILEHVSKGLRKKLRRYIVKLEAIGKVSWEPSSEGSNFEQLAEEFMRIEASGWKGRGGTALACSESTEAFFRELIQRSAAQDKARFLSLKLDGKPISMICDIQSGATVYCYKTAYDDTFAAYSPGLQTEFKSVEYLHRDGIKHGDSCTSPGSSSLSRIWGQRVELQNVVFSLKSGLAQAAVRALPKIQSVLKGLRSLKSGGSPGVQA